MTVAKAYVWREADRALEARRAAELAAIRQLLADQTAELATIQLAERMAELAAIWQQLAEREAAGNVREVRLLRLSTATNGRLKGTDHGTIQQQ